MKQKDLILVILTVAIISVAGYLAYTQLIPSNGSKSGASAKGTQVDVIGAISSNLDQSAVAALEDPARSRDYTVQVDLTTGLGNTAPFGR